MSKKVLCIEEKKTSLLMSVSARSVVSPLRWEQLQCSSERSSVLSGIKFVFVYVSLAKLTGRQKETNMTRPINIKCYLREGLFVFTF